MAMSNVGIFLDGITIRGMPITQLHPGKIWWVNNSTVQAKGATKSSDQNSGDYLHPLSTVARAVVLAKAGIGDIICLMPGHAEAGAAVNALAINKAGIAIVGLGTGLLRPSLTLDTANTSTIAVSAANVTITNVRIIGNFLSIAAGITLTATDFSLDSCDIVDTSSTLGILNPIDATGAANTVDRLSVTKCKVVGLSTSATGVVVSAHDIDRLKFEENDVNMAVHNSNAIIIITAGVVTNVSIRKNVIFRLNTASVGGSLINVGGTTSTGIVSDNYIQTAEATTDLVFTTSVGLAAFNNYITAVVGASGYLLPAADA